MRPTLLILLALKLFASLRGAVFEKSVSSGKEYFIRVLEELLSSPLANDKILLVLDPKLVQHSDIDDVFVQAFSQSESYCVVTWDTPFSDIGLPQAFVRGSYMTVIVLFENDPTPYFDKVVLSWQWNPDHIILYSLNRGLDFKQISLHPLVQRSKNIVTMDPSDRKNNSIVLHTILHNTFPRQNKHFNLHLAAGTWNKTRFQGRGDLFQWNDSDFGDAIIELASFCEDFPFMYDKDLLFDLSSPSSDCRGASLDVLDILGAKLNFSYVVQMYTPDIRWGSLENGTWIGMLADLAYHNKSLLINDFLLTEERNLHFDASYPYFDEGFSFVIRKPDLAPKWRGLLYPFEQLVWICLGIVTLISVAVLALMLLMSPDQETYDTVPMIVAAALTRQSYPVRMEAAWMYQWITWWWWFCFLITVAYTSNLVAFLTVTVPTKRIETLNDLAASPVRVIMHDNGDFVPTALKTSPDPALAKLGAEMSLFMFKDYGTIAFPSVLNGSHAVVNSEAFIRYMRKVFNATEQTYVMKDVLYSSYLVYYLRKNTPQTDVLSKNLQRLVEANIVVKMYNKHMFKDDLSSKSSELQSLGLEHLSGAFIICLAGYSLALCAFICELIFTKLYCPRKSPG